VGGKVRKYYHLTEAGQLALAEGKDKAQELLDEIQIS
jgi:DNA-binding PadR family transcriptional regulator